MLNTFRNNKSSIVGWTIAGLCALLMLPFGLDMIRTGNPTSAITVDDTEISMGEYYQRLNQLQGYFQQQMGANYARAKSFLNLEQRAIDQLVDSALLDRTFAELELTADKSQIRDKIAEHPFFGGSMSREKYKSFLASTGMSAPQLEQFVRKDVLTQQLQDSFADLSLPSDVELKALYADENRKLSFKYVNFTAAAFEGSVDTNNEENLKTFFEEHRDSFREPRATAFAVIPLTAQSFLSKVELLEEDLQDHYEATKHKLFEPQTDSSSKDFL